MPAAFGLIFFFILPLFTFFVIGLIFIAVLGIVSIWKPVRSGRRWTVPPGHRIYPSALRCPNCRSENQSPDVERWGYPLQRPITDRSYHEFKLVSVKRCPSCAARLKEKDIYQECPVCAAPLRRDERDVQLYMMYVDEKVSRALLLSFLVGFIPVVGMIFTVLYVNLKMVKPFSQYVFRGRGIWSRFLARFGILLLTILQPLPLIGYFSCPLVVLIYYSVWKHSFSRTYLAPQSAPLKLPQHSQVS